jgi:hypothetical protein
MKWASRCMVGYAWACHLRRDRVGAGADVLGAGLHDGAAVGGMRARAEAGSWREPRVAVATPSPIRQRPSRRVRTCADRRDHLS